jgi:hypothetical protein
VFRFCQEALLNPIREERGLLEEDIGNRPADIFVPDFNGRGVCVDVSVVSSHLNRIVTSKS